MEKLKDPSMILAVTANVGVVGVSAYFYKQLEAIRADLVKMSQTLTGVVRKIAEIEKGDQHKGEALHALNDQIRQINQAIDDLPSFDRLNDLDEDVNEVVAVLHDNDIVVDRPSQDPRRIRSGDRRDPPRRDPMSSRVDTSDRRVNTRRPDHRSRVDDIRTPNRREPTRQPLPRIDTRDSRDSRDLRVEPTPSYDDDDRDLIDTIRRQQPRV